MKIKDKPKIVNYGNKRVEGLKPIAMPGKYSKGSSPYDLRGHDIPKSPIGVNSSSPNSTNMSWVKKINMGDEDISMGSAIDDFIGTKSQGKPVKVINVFHGASSPFMAKYEGSKIGEKKERALAHTQPQKSLMMLGKSHEGSSKSIKSSTVFSKKIEIGLLSKGNKKVKDIITTKLEYSDSSCLKDDEFLDGEMKFEEDHGDIISNISGGQGYLEDKFKPSGSNYNTLLNSDQRKKRVTFN
jgi:hypothetical protein